jgi:transposase
MAYREVTMVEIKEVILLWRAGIKKKRIASQLTLDVKTVRRYVTAAEACGLAPGPEPPLDDDQVAAVVAALAPDTGRPHGDAWLRCEAERDAIEKLVTAGVRLSKVRRLLHRRGIDVPYPTLHRFAVAELGFGQRGPTIPVADGKPGEEVHIDTGWMTLSEPDQHGRRRKFRAWIFTPHVSRYKFVYPCWTESTETAIEACEVAWEFYDGCSASLSSIAHRRSCTPPIRSSRASSTSFSSTHRRTASTLIRHASGARKDKARVERTVRDVRDDCFAGEKLLDLADARRRGRTWSADEYGMRRHTTTQRMPREHFEADEKPHLLPAPTAPYDIPLWCEPKVGADRHAQVARALYSLQFEWRNQRVRARADSSTMRFYDPVSHEVVKVHPRVAPGRRSTDLADFPPEKAIYASRDAEALINRARSHGAAIGEFAQKLFAASPLPWTRMRQLGMLQGLIKRFGPRRVDEMCAMAVAADMVDVFRLERMLKIAAPPAPPSEPARVIPIGRPLRPATDYALLPCVAQAIEEGEDS